MSTSPDVSQGIAAAVSAALRDAGISQRDAAARTGIPLATLGRRLTGRSPFIVTELALLGELTGLTVTDLISRGEANAA